MASIVDDRGFNQGFVPTRALEVRTERRFQVLLAEMDLTRPASILELGCGTGELSDLFARRTPARVVGTDICEPFIQSAAEKYGRANLAFRVADLARADAAEQMGETFDYIVGNGIMHHLYYQLPVILPRLRSLLKPGGRLVFWEPNLYNPYVYLIFSFPRLRTWARLEPSEMAFTRRGLSRLLGDAGFTSFRVDYRDFLLPNTPDFLIRPVVALGNVLERVPVLKCWAQSVFVSAGVKA
jgi:SAM-dependent methyltransferase